MTEQNKQSDTPAPAQHVMPIASWREQSAFEAWAKENRYEMHQHPLHYLFMDKQTNAARQGWKAALQFTREIQQSSPETSSKEADLPVLTEASLPTTSRLSQLEARTSCAASVNDQLTTTGQTPRDGLVGDNQPRYTTKRLHDEFAKAKGYSRREALIDAARVADEEAEMWGYTDGSSARVVAERIRKLVGEDPTPLQTREVGSDG